MFLLVFQIALDQEGSLQYEPLHQSAMSEISAILDSPYAEKAPQILVLVIFIKFHSRLLFAFLETAAVRQQAYSFFVPVVCM